MQQNIFGLANMQGSYINDENQPIKYGDALNYASLHTYYGITTNLEGIMAQVSSRDDFFNFFAAIRENKLVSAETFAEISQTRGSLWEACLTAMVSLSSVMQSDTQANGMVLKQKYPSVNLKVLNLQF